MIEEMRLRGLGVIAEATLPMGPGFTAITGETGAGKTMVVTGLGLLLGQRADSGAVRAGAPQASVDGVWIVDENGPVAEQLKEAAPDGIDVYFDNVGGDHLEAALDVMRDGGRAALCGAIADYNATERTPGPDNMANIITRGLTLQGFTLGNYTHFFPEFAAKMGPWLASGDVVFDETIVDGIDNAVDAFLQLMRGGNIGKMLVRI